MVIAPGAVGKVSLNEPAERLTEFGLVSVKTMVDVPPAAMAAGEKALATVA